MIGKKAPVEDVGKNEAFVKPVVPRPVDVPNPFVPKPVVPKPVVVPNPFVVPKPVREPIRGTSEFASNNPFVGYSCVFDVIDCPRPKRPLVGNTVPAGRNG